MAAVINIQPRRTVHFLVSRFGTDRDQAFDRAVPLAWQPL
jgi:hypothetical protein